MLDVLIVGIPVHCRGEKASDIPGARHRRCWRRYRGALISTAALLFGAASPCVADAGADQQEQCLTEDDTRTHGGAESASCTASALWLDQMFPNNVPESLSLGGAWEHTPLLSTVYEDDSRTQGLAPIPTLVVPDEKKSDNNDVGPNPPFQRHPQRFDNLLSLFSVNDVETVLSQPGIKHQKDYKLVRKIVRNGEEWEGILPHQELTIEESRRAFEVGGFSLVINALQERWGAVASLTRQVQKEAGSSHVSVNCYLTPDTRDNSGGRAPVEVDKDGHVARRNAFEYHWDWMDVVVLQISGTKLWSVSRAPAEYLSTRDLKTKPTLDQVDRYLSPVNATTKDLSEQGRYDDFLLRPGDALYIPRGFMHNASTISPSTVEAQYGGIAFNDDLTNELLSGPSLHLTVGLEVAFEATYEALVHHALAAWFASQNRDDQATYLNALSASDCQEEKSKGVQWSTLLHLFVGDVTRRKCKAGDEDACILRRSVPRGRLWEARMSKQEGRDDRKEMLLSSILAIVEQSVAEGAANMATQVLQEESVDGNHESDFYVPAMDLHSRLSEIRCIARHSEKLVDEERVREQLLLFEQFVREKTFGDILLPFENHLESIWRKNIRQDDANLLRVGQIME